LQNVGAEHEALQSLIAGGSSQDEVDWAAGLPDAVEQQGSSPHVPDRVLKQPDEYRACTNSEAARWRDRTQDENADLRDITAGQAPGKPQMGTDEESLWIRGVPVQVPYRHNMK
jgi:hypothetical protein